MTARKKKPRKVAEPFTAADVRRVRAMLRDRCEIPVIVQEMRQIVAANK